MKLVLLLFFISFIILPVYSADDDIDESAVFVGTDDNFHEIMTMELALVEFYAPWCGHCKALKPKYAEAAKILANDGVTLVKIDATENNKLAGRYEVKGYPTLKVFRDGEASDYNGPRETKGIVDYMRKQVGPAAKPISNQGELDVFLKDLDFALVGFFSAKSSALRGSFVSIANEHRSHYSFGIIENPELIAKYSIDGEGLIAFKSYDDFQTLYEGDTKRASIFEFIGENSLPLVGELTSTNLEFYHRRGMPILTLFFNVDFEHSEKMALFYTRRLKTIANEFKGKISVTYGDAVSLKQNMVQMGIGDLPLPQIMLDDIKNSRRFKYDAKLIPKEMIDWCQRVLDGGEESYLKSQPIPEDDMDDGVRVVVGKTFESIVLDPKKDTLIEFYAPWCGHCKALAPKYAELAKRLKKSKNLTIAKIDATANDYPNKKFEVRGFPTIFLVPAKPNATPILFSGDREIEDMAVFIRKNAVNPLKTGKKKK